MTDFIIIIIFYYYMFTFHIHTAQNATRGIFVLLYFQPFFDIIIIINITVSYRTVATVREYVYVRTYAGHGVTVQ